MSRLLSCVLKSPACNATRRGTVALEFALLAPAFFLLLLGIVEVSMMIGAQELMENAAYNASRLAKTGYVATGQTQAQTVSQVVTNELSSYGALIDPAQVTMTQASYGSFSSASAGGGTAGYGTEQQIVVYTLS